MGQNFPALFSSEFSPAPWNIYETQYSPLIYNFLKHLIGWSNAEQK
jgi:hypothetical protein